jgi:hypothetical protein
MTRNRNGGPSDRELGMHRAITRRDFVQGAAVGSAGLLAAAWLPGCSGGGPICRWLRRIAPVITRPV